MVRFFLQTNNLIKWHITIVFYGIRYPCKIHNMKCNLVCYIYKIYDIYDRSVIGVLMFYMDR